MSEEVGDHLEKVERIEISEKLQQFLANTQQTSLKRRALKCLARIAKQSYETSG
jgi:hypothetical protein